MKKFVLLAAAVAAAMTQPAAAQSRQKPAAQPSGFQATAINPVFQRLNEMQQELDALRESAGKQVVVLHFTPSELPGWLDNQKANNVERSTALCSETLAERFGRVISYRIWTNGDRYFFTHVVCETSV